MSTIPASDIVTVTPSVINAGGRALDIIGLMLSTSTRVPIGTVAQFANADDVGDYFGLGSDEQDAASIYFNGFDNSNQKPSLLKVAQYNTGKVHAYLRGGDVSGLTLGQLQAFSDNLTVTIDGFAYVSGSPINLGSATSFSNAASLIQTALQALAPAVASFTASIAPNIAPGPGGVAYSTMTVTAVASGTLKVGQQVNGSGVTADTYITAFISGSGTTGTYQVSNSQTVASEAMTTTNNLPTVTYDSVSGGFVITSGNHGTGSMMSFASQGLAADLMLRQQDGAVTSQGDNASVPSSFMDGIIAIDQDWATFFTIFDPDSEPANANKLLFAQWTNSRNDRYAYCCWDPDATPTTTVPATGSLGYLLAQSDLSGTILIWSADYTKAAFASGIGASIDFTEFNGRTTFKFRSQTGLTPEVTDQTTADNLRSNGYNFYGAWATANQQFQGLADGTVSGPFEWADSYINQIWLNNALQLALMNLLFAVKSIPYNAAGYNLLRQACMDPINAALNFGAIRAGVTLSAAQAAEVDAGAGLAIDTTINRLGWYLQILDASAQVRQARGSPPMTLWYADGESVQRVSLASIAVQ